MDKWQPIETAPKDGTYVILWDSHHKRNATGCWHDDAERWYIPSQGMHGAWLGKDIATDWMPSPSPPEKSLEDMKVQQEKPNG